MTAQTPASWNVDVLVIGGGPAGVTAASLLHDKGHSALVIEKDRHPRFHIGESLLPRNIELFKQLGVIDELKQIGVVKRGAEFRDAASGKRAHFDFSKGLDPNDPVAFQVRRDQFDLMMIKAARAKGINIVEGARVSDIDISQQARANEAPVTATAIGDDGTRHEIRARFVIDASGRETFLSSKFKLKTRNPKHNSAAIFGHFSGVPRLPEQEHGNISIYWFEHGWFWVIPLPDDRTSVGMVCWPKFMKTRQGSLEEFFWQGVEQSGALKDRMKDAQALQDITATGNFSYSASAMYGHRYILVGDAYAFIDPVFSSGVYLAMKSAEFAADAVGDSLTNPHQMARHLKAYEAKVTKGLKLFSWFIYRFTSPAMRALFLNPTERFNIREAVTSVLAGEVYERPFRLRWPLVLFKGIYAVTALSLWRASRTYRARLEESPEEGR